MRRLVPMLLGAGLLYLGWRLRNANGAAVTVDFLLGRLHDVPLWYALLGSFVLGAAVVGLALLTQIARGGLVTRRYRKKVRGLETEVHQLRNLPLAPDEVAPEGVPGLTRRGAVPGS